MCIQCGGVAEPATLEASQMSSCAPEIILKILTAVGYLGEEGAFTLATAVPAVCKQWRVMCSSQIDLKIGTISPPPSSYEDGDVKWGKNWFSGSIWNHGAGGRRHMHRNALVCILKRFRSMSVCNLESCSYLRSEQLSNYQRARMSPEEVVKALAEVEQKNAATMEIATLIAERSQNIQYLSVNNCYLDENVLAAMLEKGMPELVEVDLTFNESFHDGIGFEKFTGCPKLERIWLKCCHGLGSVGANKILAACPNLKEVEMQCSGSSLRSEIAMMCVSNPLLESLDISSTGPTPLAMAALVKMPASCVHLKKLIIHDFASDDFLEQLGLHCKGLKILDISCINCSEVTQAGITHVVQGCPLLEDLSVWSCQKFTVDGVAASGPFPALQKLSGVGGVLGATDASLQALGVACPELRQLAFVGSNVVTEAGISALATVCPKMEDLDIHGGGYKQNNQTNDEAFMLSHVSVAAFGQFKALKRLSMRLCKNFEVEGISVDNEVIDAMVTQSTGLVLVTKKDHDMKYSVDGTW